MALTGDITDATIAPRREREHMRTSADGPASGTSAARIMIIDDHEISRAACRALLRTEGIDVVADLRASDDVLAAAGALHPDVAIIDVTPGIDTGFAIGRRLRALPAPPIVVFTSSTDRAQFGNLVNACRFLAKADISATAIAAIASTPEMGEPDFREP
jgi:DNA-binding NarL/FixJ family response regulator